MFIKELSQRTGVSTKTIRYYEAEGLIPPPRRADNNYRVYPLEAVERLRFIVAARALDFSLAEIGELLEARDNDALHCHQVVTSIEQHIEELDRRIAGLLSLRETLNSITAAAQGLPEDRHCDDACICYLMTVNRDDGRILIEKEFK